MAGPQFLTPRSVRPARTRRVFSLAQANSSLPLVRRVVTDIVHAHQLAHELQIRLAGDLSPRDQQAIQRDLDAQLARLQDYLDELVAIGCQLKDYQMGLVDFIGRHQGREICLCWKLGEDQIGHFHEADSGFAARQPISLLEEDQ